jgi:hypothetical protein
MPFTISPFHLPCGARCGRVEWTGVSTGEEALALVAQVAVGGPYHGQSLLILTQKMDSMTPEARNVFGGRTETPITEWLGIVITNPIIRVASKFINRMNRVTRQQMFATESEAIRWLDERAREDAARAEAKPGAP